MSSSRTATVEYLNDEVVADRGWDPQSERAFTRAAASDLPPEDYGTIEVERDEYVLEAAEAAGLDWPFSCRAGACTNCAAVVVEGEIDMEMQQILADEEVEQEDMVLTCIGTPATDHVKLLYNVKHRDRLQNRVI
ncbi:ferredoxin Fer [Halomicrobium sp. IBSBa]|uniref:ferredoxin Fer n=1 Tax=Halomicrobium sp. IBSBa TaxID=2778916 RepID=UPI001FCA1FF8|nr:ferredoxin Fer [Halomicrobium sp. IBSBa]